MNGPSTDPGDGERLRFLGRRLPPAFAVRVVVLAPGDARAHDDAEWRDALVVVEEGEVEVECTAGRRRRFRTGDVLFLTGLPLRALHNPGPDTAVLTAVSRRVAR